MFCFNFVEKKQQSLNNRDGLCFAQVRLIMCFCCGIAGEYIDDILFYLSRDDVYSTLALACTTYVYHTVCSGITCLWLAGAVKRDQTNDSVDQTTDCRPAWNKCRLNNGLECISSSDTHLSYSRPCMVKHVIIYCCITAGKRWKSSSICWWVISRHWELVHCCPPSAPCRRPLPHSTLRSSVTSATSHWSRTASADQRSLPPCPPYRTTSASCSSASTARQTSIDCQQEPTSLHTEPSSVDLRPILGSGRRVATGTGLPSRLYRGSGERCKLSQLGLGQNASLPKRFWCIIGLTMKQLSVIPSHRSYVACVPTQNVFGWEHAPLSLTDWCPRQ